MPGQALHEIVGRWTQVRPSLPNEGLPKRMTHDNYVGIVLKRLCGSPCYGSVPLQHVAMLGTVIRTNCHLQGIRCYSSLLSAPSSEVENQDKAKRNPCGCLIKRLRQQPWHRNVAFHCRVTSRVAVTVSPWQENALGLKRWKQDQDRR